MPRLPIRVSVKHKKPIDEALRRFLEERAAASGGVDETGESDQERAEQTRASLRSARTSRGSIAGVPGDVESRDVAITSEIPGRLYLPPGIDAPPLVLHVHGGAWVCGDLISHDPFCRLLARAAGVAVLAVEYRLAPEHPFPAGLDDAAAALEWALVHAPEHGVDVGRFVIAGDSAGGHLAATLTNRVVARNRPPGLVAQGLLFPVMDHPTGNHPSYDETEHSFGRAFMDWAWQVFARDRSPNDPDISPLRCSTLAAAPPTYVATAEYDILRDEGIAYVQKLRAFGVQVTHDHAEDMHHNYFVNPATVARFPHCDQALVRYAAWLRYVLTPRGPHEAPTEGGTMTEVADGT